MPTVSHCAVVCINMFNEFRKINRELTKSFYRAYVVRTFIIRLVRVTVIPIGLHHNYVVSRNKFFNIIAIIIAVLIVLGIPVLSTPKIALRPSMKEIDYRIFFLRIAVIPFR